MKAKLISCAARPPKWEIDLKRFPVLVGRSTEAEILPLDGAVSERHCEIDEVDGRLLVWDLASETGTFVNGDPVDVSPLLPGDKLTVGKSTFVACYETWDNNQSSADVSAGELSRLFDWLTVSERRVPHVKLFDLIDALGEFRGFTSESSRPAVTRLEAMFPDPLHTEHLEHMLVEEMKQANVDHRFIYAFEKTGLLVTDFNYEVIPIPDLLAWKDAIGEYEFLQEDEARTVAESADPYPVGSITMYGPDRTKTFMIGGSVFLTEQSTDPICKRWLGSSVRSDPQITSQMAEFFLNNG